MTPALYGNIVPSAPVRPGFGVLEIGNWRLPRFHPQPNNKSRVETQDRRIGDKARDEMKKEREDGKHKDIDHAKGPQTSINETERV